MKLKYILFMTVVILVIYIIYKMTTQTTVQGSTPLQDDTTSDTGIDTTIPVFDSTNNDDQSTLATLGLEEMITNDVSTWPTGDVFYTIARAIAIAEGANVKGSNPDKLNNPGDISDGKNIFGFEHHSGSDVTRFPDKQTGWQWLHDKLQNIWEGKSHSYSVDLTWEQFAKKYAGNWQIWLANVTRELNVQPSSTFRDYVSIHI